MTSPDATRARGSGSLADGPREDGMEFAELVMRRRTVRRFEDAPVDHEVLERIGRLAQHVPSAGFSQGQRLVVVTDPEQRRRVAAACGEDDDDPLGFGRWISECAAQFVPCVSENVYHRRYREPDKVDEEGREIDWPTPYWWVDIGMTSMVVMLAAHDVGLAAGFAGPIDIPALKAALGLPDEFHPIGVIPVGHALPDVRSPSLKRGWVAFEDFFHWERW
ncbi:MAG TPA: nitroreductase family protein [Candidatus Dormibacteraeota bacterium]|nr:nitroreductase family protein [Candidatus Dormibacteraeota bacterium]